MAEETPEQTAARERDERLLAAAQADYALARQLAAAPDAEELALAAELLWGTPVGFTEKVLGLGLYDWQAEVLTWFEDTEELVKGSLCTPNGAGKSERIVGSLALWWISVHPQGMVVITTKDSKQLDNQIWPAIERHKGKFPAYDFIERMVRNGTGGFIIGFTTDDPGRAEGWHKINDFTGPLLIIGDEAKSILDSIHMALDRCTYNAKLLTSSPGLTEGLFYRSQTEPGMGFLVKRVGLADCPHIPASRIKNIVETYGPDHWFTRSTLHAEFTDADSDTIFIFSKAAVRETMASPPVYRHGGKRAFCDFAAGRAENTFTFKEGNRIIQHCWRDTDPMRAVAEFIRLFIKYDLSPGEIFGDAGGMGAVYLSRFKELRWPIIGVNNESAALDPSRYPSIGAEMWHNGAAKIRDYIIPNDPVLLDQLCRRRSEPSSDGLLGYESKKDAQKRGVPSPDRGDGLVGVIAAETDLASTFFDDGGLQKMELKARLSQADRGILEEDGENVYRWEANALNSWLSVYEKPVTGRSYLCIVNPASHLEPLASHVLLVLRAGLMGADGKEEPLRLVAIVDRPLKLDARPLARLTKSISEWYGGCMVVPVVNDRGDVVDALAAAAVSLYVRRDQEVIGHGGTNRLRYGWESDHYTTSQWIGELSEAIREGSILIEDSECVLELMQLTATNARNMKNAEAIGVGVKLIYLASPKAPERKNPMFPVEQKPSSAMFS